MESSFNPARLDLARRRRGFTKGALAERVGISARIITAYERGEKSPRRATVEAFAQALDFPVEFFVGPDLDEPPIGGASFRSLSSLTARERDQTLASATIALAVSDWLESRFGLPDPAIPQYQGLDPETAAGAVRSEWGIGERPIRNVVHLLELHGVRVFSLAEDCAAMDAFSFWRNRVPYVFLNLMKSAERSRMDAAHELGHLVLHWRGNARGRDFEREADLFGAAFLMPHGSVLAEAPRGGQLQDLLAVKRRWGVSVGNLAHRMHMLGMLTDWQYRSHFIEIGRRGYRTNEPNSVQGEQSQVLSKVFEALREDGIAKTDVASDLHIHPEELNKLVFGLVLTPLEGSGTAERGTRGQRPSLQLLEHGAEQHPLGGAG